LGDVEDLHAKLEAIASGDFRIGGEIEAEEILKSCSPPSALA